MQEQADISTKKVSFPNLCILEMVTRRSWTSGILMLVNFYG